MKKYSLLFMILLFLALGVLFVHTLSFPYRAKIFPLIVIGLALFLLILEFIKEVLTSDHPHSFGEADQKMEQIPKAQKGQLKFFSAMLWMASLPMMIWLLGFIVGLPLFTLTYVKMHGEKWLWAIGLSLGILALTYVGFNLLLQTPLYSGLLIRSL